MKATTRQMEKPLHKLLVSGAQTLLLTLPAVYATRRSRPPPPSPWTSPFLPSPCQYNRQLTANLRKWLKGHEATFRQASWLDLAAVYRAKTVRDFDNEAIVKQCVHQNPALLSPTCNVA